MLFFNAPKGNERANASRHPEPANFYSYFMAINFFTVTLAPSLPISPPPPPNAPSLLLESSSYTRYFANVRSPSPPLSLSLCLFSPFFFLLLLFFFFFSSRFSPRFPPRRWNSNFQRVRVRAACVCVRVRKRERERTEGKGKIFRFYARAIAASLDRPTTFDHHCGV